MAVLTFDDVEAPKGVLTFDEVEAPSMVGLEIGPPPRARQPSATAGGPPLTLPGDTRPILKQIGGGLADLAEETQGGLSDVSKLGAKVAGEAGRALLDIGAAYAFEAVRDPVSQAQQLGVKPEQIRQLLPGATVEDLKPGQSPFERGLEESSPAVRVLGNVSRGTIESLPKMAAVAALQAGGVPMPIGAAAVFGATEEGFDPKQAAVAAALPFIGKYGGELTGLIAKKLGSKSTDVLNAVKALGGMGAVAGTIAADELGEINKLPKEQRAEAMAAAIAGQIILGPMGVKFESTSAAELAGRALSRNIRRTALFGGEGEPKVEAFDRFNRPPPDEGGGGSAAAALLRPPVPKGKPEVPASPPEPEREFGSVIEEIRAKGARTVAQVQALFPKAQLNREKARELRNQAFPETAAPPPKPVVPPPKPAAPVPIPAAPKPAAPAEGAEVLLKPTIVISGKRFQGETHAKALEDARAAYSRGEISADDWADALMAENSGTLQHGFERSDTREILDRKAGAKFLKDQYGIDVPNGELHSEFYNAEMAKRAAAKPAATPASAIADFVAGKGEATEGLFKGSTQKAIELAKDLKDPEHVKAVEALRDEWTKKRDAIAPELDALDLNTPEGLARFQEHQQAGDKVSFLNEVLKSAQGKLVTPAPPKPPPAKPGKPKPESLFERETAALQAQGEEGDLLSWVAHNMPLLSESQAKKQGRWEKYSGIYDDAPKFDPYHNREVYSETGDYPDTVAQSAFNLNLISAPTTSALWDAMGKARDRRKGLFKAEERAAEAERTLADFSEQLGTESNEKVNVDLSGLKAGDVLKADGETLTVQRVGEDGTVVLRSRRWGDQEVRPGEFPDDQLWVESYDPVEPTKPVAPPLELEKPESVEEQKARFAREQAARDQKAAEQAAKDKLAAPLKGGTGSLGQGDMLGGGDLFSPKPGENPAAPPGEKPFFKPEEQAAVDKILARLKEKLGGIGEGGALHIVPPEQPKGPRRPKFEIDPEYFTLGTELAGHYIKAGMRRFKDFATAMMQALGDKAKGYLLSWYSNARNQLKDIAHELDDEATAQKSYNQLFGIPEEAKPFTPGAGQPRPALRVARAELVPQPREFIKADRYAAHSGFTLDSEQVRGVNLILDWFQKNPAKGAFLLADGPGFGKTAQCLAVADQYRKMGLGNRILIVTQNKQIAEGRFKADAEKMGIDPSGFEMTTYTSLDSLKKLDWDLVIFDESHNLKNADRKKSLAVARLRVKHELFATATPMDNFTGAAYFLSKITGEDYLTVANRLGYTFQTRTDPVTQKVFEIPVMLPGHNAENIWENIIAYREAAVSAGAMIRREYPFYGAVNSVDLDMNLEAKMEHDRIAAHYDRLIEGSRSPTAKRNYAGQKTQTLGRWSEQQKLYHAVDAALEHLKKGGQVIIVAETDNEQSFPQPVRGGRHELKPDKYGNLRDVWKVDGAITQLKRMLAEKGIRDIADIHAPDKYEIREEVDKFQNGRVRVALATPKSGGTGIDLDDSVGGAPRLMIALSKNFAGDEFEQLIGRVSRKNTKSESEVRFLNLLDSHGDERRNSILANKIRTLRAIQGGEDLDRAGGMVIPQAPGGNRQVGFGGTEKVTGFPLEEEGVEERIYGSSGTAPPPGPPPSAQPIPPAAVTPDTLAALQRQRLPGLNGIRSLLLPQSQSSAHLASAEVLGAKLGEMHHRDEVVGTGLKRHGSQFDRLGVNRGDLEPADNAGLRFMSDMSQGRPLPGPLQATADYINRLFQKHLALLEAAGAPLETIRENYFPGMWTKESRLAFNAAMERAIATGIIGENFDVNRSTPEQRAAVKAIVDKFLKDGTASEKDALAYLTRRPMAGKESFRKQKVFDDIMTAAEMGLRPVSYNPIDLVKLKLAEMSRSIMAHGYYQELKRRKEMKIITPYEQVPSGWVKVNDKYGTIYGPPTVKLPEYVDKNLYDGMLEVARGIGVSHERVLKAGRGALGWASTSGKMVSQFATELSVLAHELGHQLDFKYGLWDRIVAGATAPGARGQITQAASQAKRGAIKRELRALADLTFEGHDNVSDYYKQKVRKKAEQMAHMLEAYIHAKDRFQEVAPTVFADFDAFIKSRPELERLAELQQGLSLQKLTSEKYVGLPIMGYRIVPNHVGDIINNYLSSTLYNSRVFGDAYRAWMGAANTLNQAQLGMGSAFHAGFTTAEVTVSAGANVLKDIYGVLRGNRSVGDLAENVGNSIIAAGRTQIVGDKVLNAWRNPDGQIDPRIEQVTRAAELAGGAFKLEKGLQTEQHIKLLRDWYSGNRLKAAARSPLAAMEMLAKPIMEYLVPRQKAGVFADLAWRIIEQNPGKALEDLTPQFRQAWNRVDARLGQVVYDRLFMHNMAKNTIQAIVRAPGWSGGTIAEIGGGFKDAGNFFVEWAKTGKLPENLPDRTAYVISLMAGVCAANGALTYAFTGQMPTGMDYWAFRTGRKDEHGNDERFVLPTYAKDILAYARHPLETLMHKTHPLVSLMNDIFVKNKDYYGVEVRSRDASAPKQAGQTAAYVVKAFEPFWTRGARREQARGAGFVRTAAPFIGVMPAPRSVTETKAEGLAHDLMLEQIPAGARTKEQAARSQAKAAEKQPTTGTYLEHTVKRLNSLNALRVFEASSPKEQKAIGSIVWGKIWNAKSTSAEDKDAFAARFNKANGTGTTF